MRLTLYIFNISSQLYDKKKYTRLFTF